MPSLNALPRSVATSEAELHAKWVASQDIGCFQQLLNKETEDGKYKLLAQLLSHELEPLKKATLF